MHKLIFVTAKQGQRCPKETRGMIYDHTPVQVPLTRFYQRMLAEGSLVLVDAPIADIPDSILEESASTNGKRNKKAEVADDRK